jgi:hypothetical protein
VSFQVGSYTGSRSFSIGGLVESPPCEWKGEREKDKAMEQWEYKVLDWSPWSAEKTTGELNAHGKEGWELLTAVTFDIAERIPGIVRYVFKRRRSLQRTETEGLSEDTRKAPLSPQAESPHAPYG